MQHVTALSSPPEVSIFTTTAARRCSLLCEYVLGDSGSCRHMPGNIPLSDTERRPIAPGKHDVDLIREPLPQHTQLVLPGNFHDPGSWTTHKARQALDRALRRPARWAGPFLRRSVYFRSDASRSEAAKQETQRHCGHQSYKQSKIHYLLTLIFIHPFHCLGIIPEG
jgi:hypothetical protein